MIFQLSKFSLTVVYLLFFSNNIFKTKCRWFIIVLKCSSRLNIRPNLNVCFSFSNLWYYTKMRSLQDAVKSYRGSLSSAMSSCLSPDSKKSTFYGRVSRVQILYMAWLTLTSWRNSVISRKTSGTDLYEWARLCLFFITSYVIRPLPNYLLTRIHLEMTRQFQRGSTKVI